MAAATCSRLSGLSLFDQQLRELLKGVRVVGKDVGNSEREVKRKSYPSENVVTEMVMLMLLFLLND